MQTKETTLGDIETALYDISSEIQSGLNKTNDMGYDVPDQLFELTYQVRRVADTLEQILNKIK